MTTRSTTVTTTNLQVNDNEFTRTPVATSVPTPSAVEAEGVRQESAPAQSNINSGINANVQRDVVISVKEVDSKVLQGSHGVGDHRATARPAVLPDNPGPREQMHGQRDSRNYNENGKSFVSTLGDCADSDAGN